VTPAGKQYYRVIERPSRFAASMEAMWQQSIDTLAKVFSDDVVEMIMLFQDCLYNSRQFDSVTNPYSNYLQFISLAGQQLDTCSFTDLLKRIEEFPATECAGERFFVNYAI
jgi:hypothetical protein